MAETLQILIVRGLHTTKNKEWSNPNIFFLSFFLFTIVVEDLSGLTGEAIELEEDFHKFQSGGGWNTSKFASMQKILFSWEEKFV